MTRQEAIKHLEEWKECISSAYRRQVIDMAIEALVDRPTGEWIDIANDEYYRCSLCGCESGYAFYYCPNCGADMNETRADDDEYG